MSATGFIGAAVSREHLSFAVDHGPKHLRPIFRAVRDGGIGFATILQHAGRFDLPTDQPMVAILGDDLDKAFGPAAFHKRSVRRFAARCRTASIVACAAETIFYATPAAISVGLRQDTLIIETLPRWEASWADLIREASPEIFLLIGRVRL